MTIPSLNCFMCNNLFMEMSRVFTVYNVSNFIKIVEIIFIKIQASENFFINLWAARRIICWNNIFIMFSYYVSLCRKWRIVRINIYFYLCLLLIMILLCSEYYVIILFIIIKNFDGYKSWYIMLCFTIIIN